MFYGVIKLYNITNANKYILKYILNLLKCKNDFEMNCDSTKNKNQRGDFNKCIIF